MQYKKNEQLGVVVPQGGPRFGNRHLKPTTILLVWSTQEDFPFFALHHTSLGHVWYSTDYNKRAPPPATFTTVDATSNLPQTSFLSSANPIGAKSSPSSNLSFSSHFPIDAGRRWKSQCPVARVPSIPVPACLTKIHTDDPRLFPSFPFFLLFPFCSATLTSSWVSALYRPILHYGIFKDIIFVVNSI